jgi:hypothetical protein
MRGVAFIVECNGMAFTSDQDILDDTPIARRRLNSMNPSTYTFKMELLVVWVDWPRAQESWNGEPLARVRRCLILDTAKLMWVVSRIFRS